MEIKGDIAYFTPNTIAAANGSSQRNNEAFMGIYGQNVGNAVIRARQCES